VFGQANWHVSDAFTFTTGARLTREDRRNIGSNIIVSNGSAPELNPVSSPYGVQLGGFNSTTTGTVAAGLIGAGTSANVGFLTTTDAAQIAVADAAAKKYFNVATYAQLTGAQAAQIAAAKAVRAAQLGALFNPTPAEPYRATQPTLTLSPSYKFSPDVTGYFSYQHGEKAGIAQQYQGVSYQVKPEKTNNFELGFKSALLDKTLIFNADVFLTKIADYQTAVQQKDNFATDVASAAGDPFPTKYASITGNVPKVRVYGLEVDGVYAGIKRTTLRFSGAYNRAQYLNFPNSAFPAERANESTTDKPYYDASGEDLPGTPRFTFNIGADYRQPIFTEHEFHTSANLAYTTSSYGSSSIYSYVGANSKVDWAIGVGKLNHTFDVSLLVKNVFNDKSPDSVTSTSITPTTPRQVALQFSARI
jgi:outer membrane receptor protein involved in Fe transport